MEAVGPRLYCCRDMGFFSRGYFLFVLTYSHLSLGHMELLSPDQRRLFDDNRREQQHYVKTAEIQKNLRQTTEMALKVLTTLSERGESIEKQEEQSRLIMESSEEVVKQATAHNSSRCYRCISSCWPTTAAPVKGEKKKKRIFRFSK